MTRMIFGLALILAACDGGADSGSDGGLDGTGTALELCDTSAIDSVWVSNLAVSGDNLTMEASFGGGCGEHEFRLCWGGDVMESEPPQVEVHLIHDGNGDSCEAELTEELSFDLSGAGLPSGEVIIGLDGESVSYTAP